MDGDLRRANLNLERHLELHFPISARKLRVQLWLPLLGNANRSRRMTDAGRSHSPTDGLSAFCRVDTALAICNQRSSMARDLLVLLRSENKHRAARCRITDGIGDGAVSHTIKDNTHPVQA